MALPTMWKNVLTATIIGTCTFVITNHLADKAFSGIPDFPLPSNTAPNNLNTTTLPSNNTSLAFAEQANDVDVEPQRAYPVRLLHHIVASFVVYSLEYMWQIWLERTFPTRPRGVHERQQVQQAREKKESLSVDEDKEEEIIQRWIAQGKVRRASISWCNTIIKYALDFVVGRLWMSAVDCLIDAVLLLRGPKSMLKHVKRDFLMRFIFSFFNIEVYTSFIGFLVVPAPQRIVFNASCGLVWGVTMGLFLNVGVPWFVNTKFMQEVINNNGTFHRSVNQTHAFEWNVEHHGTEGVEL